MVKKWHTMINVHVDVKPPTTTTLEFSFAFTIRQKMVETINQEVQNGDIRALVTKLLPDSIAKDIEKKVSPIYPVHDCYVSKVKVIKKPKLDISRLMELHGEAGVKPNAKGEVVARGDNYEPPVVDEV